MLHYYRNRWQVFQKQDISFWVLISHSVAISFSHHNFFSGVSSKFSFLNLQMPTHLQIGRVELLPRKQINISMLHLEVQGPQGHEYGPGRRAQLCVMKPQRCHLQADNKQETKTRTGPRDVRTKSGNRCGLAEVLIASTATISNLSSPLNRFGMVEFHRVEKEWMGNSVWWMRRDGERERGRWLSGLWGK